MGFVLPWELWIKNELREFCGAAIYSLEEAALFNMKNVVSLWKSYLKGDQSIHWLQIWNLVVFSKWCSINIKTASK